MAAPMLRVQFLRRFSTQRCLAFSRTIDTLHSMPFRSPVMAAQTDVYGKLLSERIIYLAGPVDDALATSITAQLLYLESQSSTKPIHIYINSPGGAITSGLAIYDTIQYIKAPVSTVCLGQACSMGSLLLASGTKGLRLALPNSIIMVHQPSGGFSGQASDIEIHANHIINTKRKLQEIYLKHMDSSMTIEKIGELLERDRFLTAEEAVELGLADKVLGNRQSNEVKEE
ncbi:unnamed protein product [Kuraishia capsulata CBS 1993]|uniref:ATP-dependent Clp protease proteolytic subunit n=1 Tax=Kuraishia capsulata CBS 1993 TaxID=1382522 RepID=W6MWX1_9ASCO|nr:uncharacterized protein KUCA_T00003960001 [Kuraishia capsulata CBS 1993]CDK27980.1 unnamed protein product [Kuraishia capsulata CBS 1993]